MYEDKSDGRYFWINICIFWMLYFDRIDDSEGINVNKTGVLKECDIWHYWYFWNYSFMFQPNVSIRCHDLFINVFYEPWQCCFFKHESIWLFLHQWLN